ncbi:hypothetical protein [Flavobacterium sp.]|uniref:hypothetical protein n=1 Tax=Flavobacterium sp. TaxID=239 RepID=UPI00286DA995|nr:hypothetical protein [Flavobacterium sp.]
MKKILPFFSYLLHPIFISVYATVLYFAISDKYFVYETIYLYVIQVLLLTVFIPLTFFYLLILTGRIDSMMISNVSQRKIPLVIHIVLLSVLSVKCITKETIPELYYFFIASIISSFLALFLVFFKKKISLHMLGMASLTVFSIICSKDFQIIEIYLIGIIIFLNGAVASSRLYMKAHSNTELVVGYTIGLLPQIILFYYNT